MCQISFCYSQILLCLSSSLKSYSLKLGETISLEALIFLRHQYSSLNTVLTLKMPRKPATENVVCLSHLLNILANFQTYFCIQSNSVDPDQTAPKGAV